MKQSKLWLKWILSITPAIIAALMYFILPYFPSFTENFISRIIFKIISVPIEWLVAFIPFSLTELLIIILIPAVIFILIIWIRRIIKSENKKKILEKGIRFTAFCLSLVWLIFMLTDGVNFSRKSVASLFNLPKREYTAKDLYTLTCFIADNTSKSREALPEDENGCAALSVSKKELLKLADDSYNNLKKDYPFLITGTHRVKSAALSRLWSYTGYTGVYCPWLLEATVNTDVPESELGHTAAHEIAHTMGFARENECNFLGYLACVTSNQNDFIYSGNLAAFNYLANALYKADKALWRDAMSHLSEGVLRDLKQRSDYWKGFEGEVMESSQKVNDTFIKSNGDKDGVLSYGKMVELMLRYYDKEGLI